MSNVLATQYLTTEVQKLKDAEPSSAALVSARITNIAAAIAGSAPINFPVAAAGQYLNPVSGDAPVVVNNTLRSFVLPANHTYRINLSYVLVTTGTAPVAGQINVNQYDAAGNLVNTIPFAINSTAATATGSFGETRFDLVVGDGDTQIAFQLTSTANIVGLAANSFLTIDRVA